VTRVCDYTLEQLRRAVADRHPMPAGVAVAAVSGSLALGLLAKVLTVTGRRKSVSSDLSRLESLAAAAEASSRRLLQLAEDDVAAFEAYLAANRSPSALTRTIEVPLAAAQETAVGLQLCTDTLALVPPELVADVDVSTALLEAARRGFLQCADSNSLERKTAAAP
jgi:formiminotetrahydrofolate cyclodeaminase